MIGCSVLRRTFPVASSPLVHGKLFVCTSEKTGIPSCGSKGDCCKSQQSLKENLYICVINKSRHTNKEKTI